MMARHNIKSMYTFMHTQVDVFNTFSHIHTEQKNMKILLFLIVYSPLTVPFFIVNLRSMRLTKRYSVFDSLFLEMVTTVSPHIYLTLMKIGNVLVHFKETQKCIYFLSLSFFFPFLSFLGVCIGGLFSYVFYLIISSTRTQYCIFLGFSSSRKYG